MGSLRDQLAAAFPEHRHKLLFYKTGSAHPPYNTTSVAQSLTRFCKELLPICPIAAPRGKSIQIVKNNFPKLAGLQHLTLTKAELPASDIVKTIEDGTFDLAAYKEDRDDRLRTLFWIPEVLRDPDAVYLNAHKIVAGNEVYVRVYNKMGSRVKLIFAMDIERDGQIIRTVPVTSFLTDPETAITYVTGQPLYERK
jgi:hypothetical protein